MLTADPRSVHWRQSRAEVEYGFSIDLMNVVCRFGEAGARIVGVQHLHLCDRAHLGRIRAQPESEPAQLSAQLGDAGGDQ